MASSEVSLCNGRVPFRSILALLTCCNMVVLLEALLSISQLGTAKDMHVALGEEETHVAPCELLVLQSTD